MINIGLSSYSMSRALSDGRMNIGQVIDYVAENKGGHIEIVPGGVLTLNGNDELTAEIVQRAKDAGIAISSYTIGANFAVDTAEEVRKEVDCVIDRHAVAEIRAFGQVGHYLLGFDSHFTAVYQYFARIGYEQAGHQLDERGFAAAVGSEQSDNASASDGEVHVVQYRKPGDVFLCKRTALHQWCTVGRILHIVHRFTPWGQ